MEREVIELNGKKYKNIDDLNLSDKARFKLWELLEGINIETATPEMLEASARIAEVLLKD